MICERSVASRRIFQTTSESTGSGRGAGRSWARTKGREGQDGNQQDDGAVRQDRTHGRTIARRAAAPEPRTV